MSCDLCEGADREGLVFWYRWKTTRVGLIACRTHTEEIFAALNAVQLNKKGVGTDAHQP